MNNVARTPPDVSVIIATYNVADYIAHAVQSALLQEEVAVEVIIVDDCSKDGTWGRISAIQDPRIKSLRLEKNSGPGAARNVAIGMAEGQWIAVLDGDDAFEPRRLVKCLQHAKADNADVVVDNIRIYREEDGQSFPMFPPAAFAARPQIHLADFIAENIFFSGTGYKLGYLKPIFSTRFLREKKLSYDTEIRIGEDYMLLAECLASGAVCAVEPNIGYIYTVRKSSISYRMSLDNIQRLAACEMKFKARYTLDPKSQKAQRKREASIEAMFQFTLLVDAIKQKNGRMAFRIISLHPMTALRLWEPLWVRILRIIAFIKANICGR